MAVSGNVFKHIQLGRAHKHSYIKQPHAWEERELLSRESKAEDRERGSSKYVCKKASHLWYYIHANIGASDEHLMYVTLCSKISSRLLKCSA